MWFTWFFLQFVTYSAYYGTFIPKYHKFGGVGGYLCCYLIDILKKVVFIQMVPQFHQPQVPSTSGTGAMADQTREELPSALPDEASETIVSLDL